MTRLLNKLGLYTEAQIFDFVAQEMRQSEAAIASRDTTIMELQKIIAGYEEANKPKKRGRPRKVTA